MIPEMNQQNADNVNFITPFDKKNRSFRYKPAAHIDNLRQMKRKRYRRRMHQRNPRNLLSMPKKLEKDDVSCKFLISKFIRNTCCNSEALDNRFDQIAIIARDDACYGQQISRKHTPDKVLAESKIDTTHNSLDRPKYRSYGCIICKGLTTTQETHVCAFARLGPPHTRGGKVQKTLSRPFRVFLSSSCVL